MASKQAGHATRCPWWSRDRLATALGEERTYGDLAERWNVSTRTLHEWANKHGLDPYEVLPALGRDIASLLEEYAASGTRYLTADDVVQDGEFPEAPNEVGRYVKQAAQAIDGLQVEVWSTSGRLVRWRLRVEDV